MKIDSWHYGIAFWCKKGCFFFFFFFSAFGPFFQNVLFWGSDFFSHLVFIQSPQFFCSSANVQDSCFWWSIFPLGNSCYNNCFHSNHCKANKFFHPNHELINPNYHWKNGCKQLKLSYTWIDLICWFCKWRSMIKNFRELT